MSNLKTRVLRIEQGKESSGLMLIAVNDGETNEEAYQRCFADGAIKPKQVLYVSPWEMLL